MVNEVDEGWYAYLDGFRLSANPYDTDSEEAMDWAWGWLLARSEGDDDEPA